MSETNNLIQSELVAKEDNNDPEYKKLMKAYSENPFYDLTKDSIIEYTAKKELEEVK
jgi:hypothetical protein